MDGKRFDDLSRIFSHGATRRGALRAALGAILGGGAVVASGAEAEATVRRNYCRAHGVACSKNKQCCSNICETRRTLPRNERNRCVCIPVCDGKVCGPNSCGGRCGVCESGETCCGGGAACADLQNDEDNCGACGNVCGAGTTCCSGVCKDLMTDEANCGNCGAACEAGETCCSGFCFDLQEDVDHCGTCSTVCEAGDSCCSGDCADLQSSTAHCGTCGDACGVGETCCEGSCKDLQTDDNNCGECGTVCTGGYSCNAGTCSCGGVSCGSGLTCCSDSCVDLKTDEDNCLACGNACAADVEYCERLYNIGCNTICQEGGSKFGHYDTDLNFYDGTSSFAYYRHYVKPINPDSNNSVPQSEWQACTADSDCDANCPTRLTWWDGLDKPVIACGCNRIFCLGGSPSDFDGNGYCVAYA